MRLNRVFIAAELNVGARVALPAPAAGHLLRVLRLRTGDPCVLFNGDGHDYPARIATADIRQAAAVIDACQPADTESALTITLAQALARGDKMDWIVQKATELGVATIVPLTCARSEVKLDPARADRRLAHWRQVAISACEQCGRARLPILASPTAPAALTPALPPSPTLRLILDPLADAPLSEMPPAAGVVIAIGPEGGWADSDLDALATQGFKRARLGPRILRTETAGLAAIAALQAWHGDLG